MFMNNCECRAKLNNLRFSPQYVISVGNFSKLHVGQYSLTINAPFLIRSIKSSSCVPVSTWMEDILLKLYVYSLWELPSCWPVPS